MKYIVTVDEAGEELIFTFPSCINHDAFAEALECFRAFTTGKWERIHRWPISAGFIIAGECSGGSETLGLSARETIDTKLYKSQ